MPAPVTRYATCGDINIAYQVLGEGPVDLVYTWGWMSHLDFQWGQPTVASFLNRLASFSRLIMLDKRGTGLSDPVGTAPTFEERMEDIRAVMDAVGSDRAALLGFSEGTALSALFSVTYPERTTSLVLYDGFAVGPLADPDVHEWNDLVSVVEGAIDRWGQGDSMRWAAPSLEGSATVKRFWGAFERCAMGPGMARAMFNICARVDFRDVLPMVTVPTLVLHHADSLIPAAGGRLMAELIPGARYVELPGGDHLPGAGDPEAIAAEIEEFLTGARAPTRPDRVLATVLFTDIVDSTRRAADLGDSAWRRLREEHDAMTRSQLESFGGREVKQTGDGFLASFDGPARAIRCACAVRDAATELKFEIRAGIHTGECEVINDDLAGIAVHVAARVGAAAGPGEVLVSGTVKELVMGSGIEFVDRGAHELKGVPGEWRLFAVGADNPHAPVRHERMPVSDRVARRFVRSAPGLVRLGARVLRPRT